MRDVTALQSVLLRFAQVDACKRNISIRAELCAAAALRLVVAEAGRVLAREDHLGRDALAIRGERSVKWIDARRPHAASGRDGVITRIGPALRGGSARSVRASVRAGEANDTAAMAHGQGPHDRGDTSTAGECRRTSHTTTVALPRMKTTGRHGARRASVLPGGTKSRRALVNQGSNEIVIAGGKDVAQNGHARSPRLTWQAHDGQAR